MRNTIPKLTTAFLISLGLLIIPATAASASDTHAYAEARPNQIQPREPSAPKCKDGKAIRYSKDGAKTLRVWSTGANWRLNAGNGYGTARVTFQSSAGKRVDPKGVNASPNNGFRAYVKYSKHGTLTVRYIRQGVDMCVIYKNA